MPFICEVGKCKRVHSHRCATVGNMVGVANKLAMQCKAIRGEKQQAKISVVIIRIKA